MKIHSEISKVIDDQEKRIDDIAKGMAAHLLKIEVWAKKNADG